MTLKLTAPPKGILVAAVAFDEQTETVAATAAALARRFDLEARFVHVVGPISPDLMVADAPASWSGLSSYQDMLLENAKASRRRLGDLVDGLALGSRGFGDVIFGEIDTVLIEYAKLHRASVLMTGCSREYGVLEQSFSTALSLMAHAPMPVLVVSKEHRLDLSKEGLRILLADDLRPESEEVARRAFEVAADFAPARVRQVHVQGGNVLNRAAAIEAMKARAIPQEAAAAALGCEVERDVRLGKSLGELDHEIREFMPDLVVFGRHKAMRTRPFAIGRMPLRTMLHFGLPLMIVPPCKELYANLHLFGAPPALTEGASR